MRKQMLRFGLAALLVGAWMSETSFASKAEDQNVAEYTESSDEETVGATEIEAAPENGWEITEYSRRYYENGVMVTNQLKEIDGEVYYFYYSGYMATGVTTTSDGKTYYFDTEGRMKKGWEDFGGECPRYFGIDGVIKEGLFEYEGYTYYSRADGYLLTNAGIIDKETMQYSYFDYTGKLIKKYDVQEGFNDIENNTVYVKKNENDEYYLVENDWIEFEGAWYRFGYNGNMLRGCNYDAKLNGEYYLFRADENGKRIENSWYKNTERNCWEYFGVNGIGPRGLFEVNGVQYFFDNVSIMLSDVTHFEDGQFYVIDKSGKVLSVTKSKDGWNKIADEWYYCENGEPVVGRWKKIGDYWYSFDALGRMNHDTLVTNWNGGHYDSGRVDSNGHRVFGWYKIADKMWEYYGADGVAVTGLQTINGVTYYFNNNGIMMTGIVKEFPNYYRLDENGKLLEYTSFKDGWNSFDGKWYYVQNGEICVNRWVTSGGYKYYLRYDGTMAVGRNSVNENGKYTFYEFDEKGHMITGWSKTKTGSEEWCYYDSDGRGVEGLQTINGKMYYFTYGIMVTRYTFVEDGKIYSSGSDGVVKQISTSNGWYQGIYYVENGKLVTGWKKIDNKWYYFDSMGIRTTGLCPELNYNYYFDDDGVMQTGWIKYKSYWMWADSSGKLVENGWMSINGKSYYFIDKIMETGICKFDGYWTWFDANGNRLGATKDTEKWIKTGKGYYYIMKDGTLATGEVLIGGKYYYFNPDGLMQTGYAGNGYYGTDGAKVKNTWVEVSYKTWMYFDNNGNAANGWLKLDNKWYYFTRGYYRVGDEVIDGKKYHFDNAGVWDGKTVQIADGWYLIDGKYKYRENGHDVVGVKVINGSEYYFDYSGVMVTSQYNGITKAFYGENGKRLMNGWGKSSQSYYGQVDWWYYANNGELYAGLHTIGGKQYYFDEYNRNMITTDYLNPTQTIFYEIGSDGVVKEIVKANGTGWIKTKSGKWLYSENGIFYKDMHAVAGKYYCFEQGVMVKNQIINGYGYFDSTGVLSKWEGWQKVNGSWAYLHNGYCAEGSRYIDGKWYYFEYTQASDIPVIYKGLYSYERKVYYYNGADGGRTTCSVKEGWNKFGDEWYYVVDGAPAWGALKISGKWYYFSDGVMMHDATVGFSGDDSRFGYCGADGMLLLNAWKKIGDVWYYFGSDGRYVTGTHTINGVVYHFSNSGILQD